MTPKWRPPLALVLGGTLAGVLVLPLAGIWSYPRLSTALGEMPAKVIVVGAVLGTTVVLGWLLWRLLLRPMRALASRAARVREGGAVTPLDHYGTAELGALGAAVLEMADTLKAREQAVRGYTDHVTHELRTPLSAIRGAAELVAEDTDPTTARLARTILQAETRMEALLDAARAMAAAREPRHHGTCRLADVAAALDTPLAVSCDPADARVPLALDGALAILTQLARNAVEAGAGRLDLRVRDDTLYVEDDGSGLAVGDRDRVFDAFYTTRRDAGGTGMGLPAAAAIAEAHGLRLEVTPDLAPDPKKGASFALRLGSV